MRIMRRREFITLLMSGAALGWPLAARAQQESKIYRIGFLGSDSQAGMAPRVESLRAGLRDLGYAEGTNVIIEYRYANEKYERLSELAADLMMINRITAPIKALMIAPTMPPPITMPICGNSQPAIKAPTMPTMMSPINAAAVALADMRPPNAAKVLIEVLSKPESENSRGTLLYALEEVRGKAPLKLLVDIILSGTYEARQEATGLIASGTFTSTRSELHKIIESLKASSFADEEQASAIKDAIASISRLTRKRTSYSFNQFITPLARANKLSDAKIQAVLKEFAVLVVRHLKKGERVRLPGLGYFSLRHRPARMGRKSAIKKSARAKTRNRTVMFRPSKDLRDSI
jgi:nucleoid DNA-binding protein